MTPRERWLAVLTRQKPDRIPMDYWATREATAKLKSYLGCRTKRQMLRKLRVDFVVKVLPRYAGPKLPKNHDVFGRIYRYVGYGTGTYRECVNRPLAKFRSVKDVKRSYTWPSPDWWDYSQVRAHAEANRDYPLQVGGSEPFLIYKDLRGQEQSLIDLIENPELVHYCLKKLFDLAYVNTQRLFEQMTDKLMLTYVSEDMGGQTDLIMSPEHIRTYLLPGMKRVSDLAHQAGAFVFHHNDGACRRIIPDMIELGIDILNPIQWRTSGMEREGLKRDFGSRVIFHGAMDNQYTLPFGTVEEVRQEVRDNLEILGRGGGYILAPCHNIQAVSPPENIVTMYEAALEYGRP
jgi:uroporphyrinogen decarboxylase